MKKSTPILLLILSFLLISCSSKPEKKEPAVHFEIQKYKIDDEELIMRTTKDSVKIKSDSLKN